jgi:hypothetical protein
MPRNITVAMIAIKVLLLIRLSPLSKSLQVAVVAVADVAAVQAFVLVQNTAACTSLCLAGEPHTVNTSTALVEPFKRFPGASTPFTLSAF